MRNFGQVWYEFDEGMSEETIDSMRYDLVAGADGLSIQEGRMNVTSLMHVQTLMSYCRTTAIETL